MAKTMMHVVEVGTTTEAHNSRTIAVKHAIAVASADPADHNEHWVASADDGSPMSIAKARSVAAQICKAKSGRKLYKGGKIIREGVVLIERHHRLADLQRLAHRIEAELQIQTFQIHLHKDEGHHALAPAVAAGKAEKVGEPVYHYHAHMVFLWQGADGRTAKPGKAGMGRLQDLCAEVLGMERGECGSKHQRLSANEYREAAQKVSEQQHYEIMRQREQLTVLDEAVAELEEAETTQHNKVAALDKAVMRRREEVAILEKKLQVLRDTWQQLKQRLATLKAKQVEADKARKLSPLAAKAASARASIKDDSDLGR